jgi:holo-[acyl-carrier protein] synthase
VNRGESIIGVGVDIVEVSRIKKLIMEHDIDFLKRVFTENEISYCQNKKDEVELFATLFAVKEAFAKALGTGMVGKMEWTDIEVHFGKTPSVETKGETQLRMRTKQVDSVLVSFGYTREFSIAQIILQ